MLLHLITTIGSLPADVFHWVDWFQHLKTADKISFGGTTAATLLAITSTAAARAAYNTVRQMKAEHVSEVRPRLTIHPNARSLRAIVAHDRFDITETDNLPFTLMIENNGRGRGSDIVVTCGLRFRGKTLKLLVGRGAIPLENVGAGGLSALIGPERLTLTWQSPVGAQENFTCSTTNSHHARLDDLNVDQQEPIEIPAGLMRAWVGAVLALEGPVTLYCNVTYKSASDEPLTANARIVLEKSMHSVDSKPLNIGFRVDGLPPHTKLTLAQRKAEAERRRQQRAFVADTLRKAKLLESKTATYFRAS